MSKTVYQNQGFVLIETVDTFVWHDPHSTDCVVAERAEFLKALCVLFWRLSAMEQNDVLARVQ